MRQFLKFIKHPHRLPLFLLSFTLTTSLNGAGTKFITGRALPQFRSCLRALRQDAIDEEIADQHWGREDSLLSGAKLLSGSSKSQVLTFSGFYRGEEVVLKLGNFNTGSEEARAIAEKRIDLEVKNYSILRERLGEKLSRQYLSEQVAHGHLVEKTGAPFVIYRDLRAKELGQYLREKLRNSPLPIEQQLVFVLLAFRDMAVIINMLHERGVLYLDIKLDNFVLDPFTGKLRLIDYESLGVDTQYITGSAPVVTEVAEIFYPGFAAPELDEMTPPYTASTDIFAFASCLKNFYDDKFAFFLTEDSVHLRSSRQNSKVKQLHDWINHFYTRNTQREASERMQSMADVISGLNQILP